MAVAPPAGRFSLILRERGDMGRHPSLLNLLSENKRLRRTLEALILEEKMGIDELARMCREKGELLEN
jgi:hypothetical protein